MFLTRDELEQLTGSPRKGKQIAWLQDNGYTYDINLRGEPVVAREQVLQRQHCNHSGKTTEPDFSKILAA